MRIENDIKLVLFSSKLDKNFEKIANIIPDYFPKNKIFCCSNMSDFSNTLADVLFGYGIVLIVIRDKNELNNFYQISERLKDHSTIVILSDDIDDMAQEAIRLYPRYTTFIKNEYNDVSQVLFKMINNIENKTKGESNGRSYRCN